MPDTDPLEALVDAAAACPEPPVRTLHRDAYYMLGEWPLPPTIDTDAETMTLRVEIRPGVYDRPGGGACGLARVNWTDQPEREYWTDWYTEPDCVAAPEPAFGIMLVLGVMVLAGFRRPKRKKAPTGR